MKRFRYISKLIDSKKITPTVKHLVFETPNEFNYHAGMFMSISFMGDDGKPVGRSYSLASVPTLRNKLELCVKLVEGGKGSTHLFGMKPGDTLKMMGPMGTYFIKEEQLDKDIVFISTGTGIAPFRGMINDLLNRDDFSGSIKLVNGVRFEDEVLYKDEFEALDSKHDNFSYLYTVSRPNKDSYTGPKGRVQSVVEANILPSISPNTIFYMCGLGEMLDSVKELLVSNQIQEEHIFIEKYD